MSRKFNEKYVVNVDGTHMLSIFSGSNIEHPYRFQPYVKLVVPFCEYKQFCKIMVDLSIDLLSFESGMYKRALESEDKDSLLLRLYYLDLSKSVLNEIILSASNRRDGTIICQDFTDMEVESISFEDIGSFLMSNPPEYLSKGLDSFKKDITVDFSIDNLSNHNKTLLHYAMCLRVLSFQPNPKMFSLS